MTPVRRRGAMEEEEGEGGGGGSLRWMLTYSDMITLLLALFVILYALNAGSPQKLQAVARVLASTFNAHTVVGTAPGPSVIQGASGGLEPGTPIGPRDLQGSNGGTTGDAGQTGVGNPGTARAATPLQLQALAAKIAAAINQDRLSAEARVQSTPQGVVVTLSADYLFAEGHAHLSAPGVALIRTIGALMTTVPNPVVVLGATDILSIHTAKYPSNWQLGAMRAANVAYVLGSVPGFRPQRLLASTTSKYHPVASNATAAGRALNRRVVIWVIRANTLVNSLFQANPNAQGAKASGVSVSGGG